MAENKNLSLPATVGLGFLFGALRGRGIFGRLAGGLTGAALGFLFHALQRGGTGQPSRRQTANIPLVYPISPRLMTGEEYAAELAGLNENELGYINWQGGHSSWIAALRYNPIAGFGQMRVKKNGKVYTFARMAFATFKEWFTAQSWGRYFNAYLKGRYSRY